MCAFNLPQPPDRQEYYQDLKKSNNQLLNDIDSRKRELQDVGIVRMQLNWDSNLELFCSIVIYFLISL